MKHDAVRVAGTMLLLPVSLLLAACGGGGGGASGPGVVPTDLRMLTALGATVNRDEIATETEFRTDGSRSLRNEYLLYPGMLRDSAGAETDAVVTYREGDNQLILSEQNSGGVVTGQRLLQPMSDRNVESDLLTGFTLNDINIPDDALAFLAEDGVLAFVEVQEYSVLGAWIENLDNFVRGASDYTDTVAFAHFGLRSPASDRPSTGTATYSGDAAGYYALSPTRRYIISIVDGVGAQEVALMADFGGDSISGRIRATAADDTLLRFPWADPTTAEEPPLLGENLAIDLAAGGITGSTFSGAFTVTTAGGVLAGLQGQTGDYEGAFYGDAGEEVAGTARSDDDTLLLGIYTVRE